MNKSAPVRRNRTLFLGFAMGTLTIILAFLVGSNWGPGAAWASVAYAILVTLFLLAQIVGFVMTQVTYSESVEVTKFQVLEVEGIEWRKS